MADTVFILGEAGTVIEHDLPLGPGIEGRLRTGVIHLVDKDGQPVVDPVDEDPKKTNRSKK